VSRELQDSPHQKPTAWADFGVNTYVKKHNVKNVNVGPSRNVGGRVTRLVHGEGDGGAADNVERLSDRVWFLRRIFRDGFSHGTSVNATAVRGRITAFAATVIGLFLNDGTDPNEAHGLVERYRIVGCLQDNVIVVASAACLHEFQVLNDKIHKGLKTQTENKLSGGNA
jgi:hypothetical protein